MALTWKNDSAARMGLARFPSAGHWANAQCKAWWIALPGLVGGRQWYDVLGQYPWTISYATYSGSGTFQRPSGYWSPTFENGDYQYNAADSFDCPSRRTQRHFRGPVPMELWPRVDGSASLRHLQSEPEHRLSYGRHDRLLVQTDVLEQYLLRRRAFPGQ